MNDETQSQNQLIHLTIDGKEIAVPKGTTVYQAAKKLEIDIPIFCYLDRMPPFGACRMCLVEVEKMGKPQTSCTLEVAEGMVVKTQTTMAVEARKEIIELLLLNHPLDCPICDRGGECPLQDNAMACGPGKSRFYEEKRRYVKPLPVGPVLMLDRERCIICARCTRFSDVIAGDHALEFKERGYRTEVGTPDNKEADSKFIGNTIMICPVGALTSRVYRFRSRPWDNEPTESTCTLCPVGCSLILDSRDGEIMRTRSRENSHVNDIWMCDKGWFGYEFVEHAERLKWPLINKNGKFERISWEAAFELIVEKLIQARSTGRIGALGGNPLTVEENYLLQKLMREGLNSNHLDSRIGTPIFSLEEEGLPPGMEMSIRECEQLNYIILLGIDITEEFPVIWLRIRQAINKGAQTIFAGHYLPEIKSYLSQSILHPPGEEINVLKQHFSTLSHLKGKGAIFVGSQYLSQPYRKNILANLIELQKNTPALSLNIMEGNGNSRGARFAGMHPELGPFGKKVQKPGFNSIQLLEHCAQEGWDFLYVIGSDPSKKFASDIWKNARKNLQFLVVQDLFLTKTAREADLILPTLCFVEKEGRFINIEGRIQKLLAGKAIPNELYSDGEIFRRIGKKLGIDLLFDSDFIGQFSGEKIQSESFRTIAFHPLDIEAKEKVNDDTFYITFGHSLFDYGNRMQHDPHLIQLAKSPKLRMNPNDAVKIGINDATFCEVSSEGHSFSAKVKWDSRVAEKTLVLPIGFENELPVQELGAHWMNGVKVKVKPLQGGVG